MEASWESHHRKVAGMQLPMSATLSNALELFGAEHRKPGFAIDLGCGIGIDTIALLQKRWQVMAVDKDYGCLLKLKEAVPHQLREQLAIAHTSFSEAVLPDSLLVNASFSLPFCKPKDFASLWKKIIRSILPGGRFTGHFFGHKDSWSTNPDMTFHDRETLMELFTGFTIEHFEETEKDGKTLGGKEKHWHVFHVVGCGKAFS